MSGVSAAPAAARPARIVWRWLFAPLRFLASIVAAQSAVGALFLLGYVYRRMQAHAVARWTGERFAAPRWLLSDRADATPWRRYTGSLWQNLGTGLSAALPAAVILLPSGVALSVSWYAGWNNSFYKGYEHAAVGPLLGWLGIVLGMLAMTYLPYAQARHALTGDWRMFFSWRQNLTLIGMRPLRNLLLPLLYTLAGLVVAGARGLLTFAPQVPAFAGLEEDPAGFAGAWFLWWGIPFVILLYLAKRCGARLYAGAVLAALDKRRIAHGELHDAERYYIRGARETFTVTERQSMARLLVRVLWALPLWFPLFALVYVQQFVNFIGAWGWLNHPLLWLPVLAYTP